MEDRFIHRRQPRLGPCDDLPHLLTELYSDLKHDINSFHVIYAGLTPDRSFAHRTEDSVIEQITSEVNLGKHNIIFDGSSEGLPIATIQKIDIINNKIKLLYPEVKFFFLTGAFNGQEAYQRMCQSLNITPTMEIISCRFFEHLSKQQYLIVSTPPGPEYKVGIRPKNYLCFNKVMRPHRIRLLEQLLAEDLVNDKCYYSFYDTSISYEKNYMLRNARIPINFPNIHKNAEIVSNLRLNFDVNRTNPIDMVPDDFPLFNDTYFSVVTETVYYDTTSLDDNFGIMFSDGDCIFHSEKIYKPIAMLHPFIVLSRPHTVAALRECGFQSFHPYIDETYDTIENDHDRMIAIVNEIKRLTEQTPLQWLTWCSHVKSITEHNQQRLRDNNSYIVNKNLSSLC